MRNPSKSLTKQDKELLQGMVDHSYDLFIFNRTTQVVDKWLNKYKGHKFDFNKLPRFKFDGLILCLKDDASIIDLLIKNKLFKS